MASKKEYGDPYDVESYGWYHLRRPGLRDWADEYGTKAHLLYAYGEWTRSSWKSTPIKGRAFGPYSMGWKKTLCGLQPSGWHIAPSSLGKKHKCKKCSAVMKKWIYGGGMKV